MIAKRIAQEVDVIIYNAGSDPHVDDPLGGVLTTAQLKKRDAIVFEVAQRFGVPSSVSLAGGYQGNIRNVLDVHGNTCMTACGMARQDETGAAETFDFCPGRVGGSFREEIGKPGCGRL